MSTDAFGARLREWRTARRLSQERLAAAAEVSTRHLSFLETGKSAPSRTMVLVLASALDLPLRDRNALLHAAGFAPVYRESAGALDADSPLRRTIETILRYHGPIPAVAVTPQWDVLQMNAAAMRVFGMLLPQDVDPIVMSNVLHALFHPQGLRQYIVNWEEVAASTLHRVHHEAAAEIDRSANEALLASLSRYPSVASRRDVTPPPHAPDVYLPVHLKSEGVELRLFTTITTLGTPLDVSAQELRIEVYYPADAATEDWLNARARSG
jgi:transcriptional regulator with XRE-family HTH domain